MAKGGPMAKKRFSQEQIILHLLRHRTLPEIRNSPPSTLHPPRYQTQKGVVELLESSVCQILTVLNYLLALIA